MRKVKCVRCNKEIGDEDVFVHEGRSYCPECILKHVKDTHLAHPATHLEAKREASRAELEHEKSKHSPEARRAHTYKHY